MPLKKGSNNKTVSKNIKRLIDEGRSREQAIAIAFSEASKTKKRSKEKK